MRIKIIETDTLKDSDKLVEYGEEAYIDIPSQFDENEIIRYKGYFVIIYYDGYHVRFKHSSDWNDFDISYSNCNGIQGAFEFLKSFNIKHNIDKEQYEKDFWR